MEEASTSDGAPGTEWLADALVREAGEAIVVTGPDGIIRLWNRGAERVFGHPADQALGASLDLIIPPKLRAAHWAGFDKTMETGETRYGDTVLKVPATHADGRRMSIEFSVALLRDDAGNVVAISAIIRDVTDRWHAERALKARVAELEKRLAGPEPSDAAQQPSPETSQASQTSQAPQAPRS